MKLSIALLAVVSSTLCAGFAPHSLPVASSPRTALRDAVPISWSGKNYKSTELPEGLPEGAREALEYFAAWAAEEDYVVQLSDSASFAMFSHKRKVSSKSWSKAIVPALEQIEELAPLPDRDGESVETGDVERTPQNELTVSWGEVHDLEHDAACFFELKNSDHMRSLLEYIAEKEEKPAGWAEPYAELPGLILHEPLVGIIVGTAPGVEEWDPLNEMVNRISRIMLVRRFRTIPNWITQGLAWNVEFEVRGNIFCFPHRDRFVGVAEHGGWRDDLKVQFKSKKGPLLDLEALVGWRVGTYDPIQAGRAWGTISYISRAKPGALGDIIEELRLLTDEKGRMTRADGTWERIPGFSPSAEDQLEVLQRHLGPEFLEDVTQYFNKGMKKPATR